jgi:hypothetical protein
LKSTALLNFFWIFPLVRQFHLLFAFSEIRSRGTLGKPKELKKPHEFIPAPLS